ncbi:uncharacterized protein LY79DRAFT_549073 [Colletotrichum navitas]|uniref:Uncharacterized protein n=1 Tax=Colletotrichum navitas TaxID=681940 RepID=A0AAD8Q2X3_9PEZI|nr:uncharacterized protein LY79DRAFT_549073 [Colletotrichum navitas]KAK1594564.1 hypothetical protein LY79DRAFT_549073 [Colletotrichum navitas]
MRARPLPLTCSISHAHLPYGHPSLPLGPSYALVSQSPFRPAARWGNGGGGVADEEKEGKLGMYHYMYISGA